MVVLQRSVLGRGGRYSIKWKCVSRGRPQGGRAVNIVDGNVVGHVGGSGRWCGNGDHSIRFCSNCQKFGVTVAERSGKEPPLELSPLAKNHYFVLILPPIERAQ